MGQHFIRPSKAAVRARAALVAPLVAAGLSQAEIVRRTGLSQQWISAWLRRPPAAGAVTLRRRDARARAALDARRGAALQAYEAGMGQAEIARRWQVSAVSVHRWVQALTRADGPAAGGGRPPRGTMSRAARAARRAAALQAYDAGMAQVEIARRWQVTAARVSQWVKARTRGDTTP